MTARGAIALTALLVLAACGGPKPSVESVEASDVKDQATIVAVTLRNSGGDGSVRLTVSVKERGSGRVVGREERNVEVKQGERLTIAIEVHVPAGVTSVEADAEVRYPPD